MSDRPGLADRLALAIVEHGPLPGYRLALVVGVRRQTVVRELEADPRFERAGGGRGTRWTLHLGTPGRAWDGLGRDSSEEPRELVGPADAGRLGALEDRVAELERRLAELGAPTA